jgi:hypothetical protein
MLYRRMKTLLLIFILMSAACNGETRGYKAPSLSGDVSHMSADTLCYRAEGARDNPAYGEEIRARGLDCREILESRPPSGDYRFD